MPTHVINPLAFQPMTMNNVHLLKARYGLLDSCTSLLDLLEVSRAAAEYLRAGLKPHLVSKLHLDHNQYPLHPLEDLEDIAECPVSDNGLMVHIDDGSLEVPVNAAVLWCHIGN